MNEKTKTMTLSEELLWRGLMKESTFKDLSLLDTQGSFVFYHGFDASAPSQTIGNLAAMMADLVFLRHGHRAIVLAGGATSLIGDPGGKDKERPLQTEETIAYNVACAEKQIQKIYRGHEFTLVNNITWTKNLSILDFLRDVGKHFSVGELIKRDYIADRLGEGGAGISFTEFSYTLLQGYDFLYLFEKYGCTLQIGGSDQWANCLSGVSLIRKKHEKEAHVITLPLIINRATGKKFGKSESGAVWLDKEKTPVLDFYQFWMNVDDESAKEYVKIYTEIYPDDYEELVKEFDEDRSKRALQKYLAYEVTKLVHGEEEAQGAKEKAEALFGGNALGAAQEIVVTQEDFSLPMAKFLAEKGITASVGEARRLITGGAVVVGDEKIGDPAQTLSPFEGEKLLTLGKKKFYKFKKK